MKKVVVTVGPIPARLDSVKFLTNRFKGKLALDTAKKLHNLGNKVTIVCWEHLELKTTSFSPEINVVKVSDVYDYYDKVLGLVDTTDAFVLAAAVANLTPKDPFIGKFPSHLYREGDEFNIKFVLSPRIIDAIKKKNPRCTLIAYKLFEGKDALIDAAKKSLEESKANAIFANEPKDVMTKYLVLPEGAVIEMPYSEHVHWIHRIINLERDKTLEVSQRVALPLEDAIIEHFEKYVRGHKHGACAVNLCGICSMTARRHDGISHVYSSPTFEDGKYVIYSKSKPTKNASLMYRETPVGTITWHLHRYDARLKNVPYTFPGTSEEQAHNEDYFIKYHGSIIHKTLHKVDWTKYYERFPKKYFNTHSGIKNLYENGGRVLDVGGNLSGKSKFLLDPNIPGALTYDTIQQYDNIVINNAINYLSVEEITKLKKALLPGGRILANTFLRAPEKKITENEICVSVSGVIRHVLFFDNEYYYHEFFDRDKEFWKKLGFSIIEEYNEGRSALLEFTNPIGTGSTAFASDSVVQKLVNRAQAAEAEVGRLREKATQAVELQDMCLKENENLYSQIDYLSSLRTWEQERAAIVALAAGWIDAMSPSPNEPNECMSARCEALSELICIIELGKHWPEGGRENDSN